MTPHQPWGPAIPPALGNAKIQAHEQVIWQCAMRITDATKDMPWLALVGGTALRHSDNLERASLDLDFLASDKGKEVGLWLPHILKQIGRVDPESVHVVEHSSSRTVVRYRNKDEEHPDDFKIDLLDPVGQQIDMRRDVVTKDNVKMLAPPKLARLKLNTLLGEKPRFQARDIYDITKLLRRRDCSITHTDCKRLTEKGSLLFVYEDRCRTLFEDDKVLNASMFDTVRHGFMKTIRWRTELIENGLPFQPVEQRPPMTRIVRHAGEIRIMENRPTREGQLIAVARNAAEAASCLIDRGLTTTNDPNVLATEIERKLAQDDTGGDNQAQPSRLDLSVRASKLGSDLARRRTRDQSRGPER